MNDYESFIYDNTKKLTQAQLDILEKKIVEDKKVIIDRYGNQILQHITFLWDGLKKFPNTYQTGVIGQYCQYRQLVLKEPKGAGKE